MSDVSRCSWTTERFIFTPPTYKGDALDKLRAYRASLWKRTERFTLMVSMDGLIFDFAERAYEAELKRLDQLIKRQIRAERQRAQTVGAELDLSGTELTGDLSPRFPYNHRAARRTYGDDYVPATGHLTKRGVEICYRLFDMAKSPLAVAYLMGMTLRSAERRQRSWRKVGGPCRERLEVKRVDLTPFQGSHAQQHGS